VSTILRGAVADPPYIGQSFRHYRDHADYAGEVNHEELIQRLERDYDCWALCASSPSLSIILPLCPSGIRVMAWVKPFCAYKRNVRVAYAWEPVIVKVAPRLDGADVTRDFVEELMMADLDLALAESITMKKGLTGAKPERFCHWLFAAMGLRPSDSLDDLYPGTGAVSAAWESWDGSAPPTPSQISVAKIAEAQAA